MKDPQRIVDEIRAFLMASDQSLNDRVQELATNYKDACAEVNARLSRCAQLIRQGLRAEALHLAEAEPKLLTALQSLDFPDRAAWLDVVGIYQLDAPPDLEHGISEHLSAAYTEHDPQRNLLRKHRKLALARAPLRERLSVIRELARVDSGNPIWDEDCRMYETARFKQIQAEAVAAARRGDASATDALERELLDEPWSSRPPRSLLQGVRQAAESLRQAAAKLMLPAAEVELNEAFSALDVARARAARASWIAQVEAARLPLDHPMRERVEPALLWIDKEDLRERHREAYRRAEAHLVEALDDPAAPADELERLFATLVRAEQDLLDPPGRDALTSRYRGRLAGLDLAASRRRRMLVGSCVAATIGVGVMAVFLYRSFERSAAERQAVESLDNALASGRLEDVEDLLAVFAKTRPEVLQSVGVLSRLPAVDEARAAESTRSHDLEQLVAEAESAPLTGQEPPSLDLARKLAKTDEEKRSIENLARRIDRRNRDLAVQVDAKLLPEFDAVSLELDAIETAAAGSVAKAMNATTSNVDVVRSSPEILRRIMTVSQRLEQAMPKSGPLSQVAQARSARLRERLRLVGEEVQFIGRETRSSEALTAAIRRLPADSAGYVSAVTERAVVFQGKAQQAELQKVLSDEERPVWESALKWAVYAGKWAEEPRPLGPDAARARIEFCQGFLKENPSCPNAQALKVYLSYLEPIARRDAGDDSLRDRLARLLSSPSIDPLYMVTYRRPSSPSQDPLRYYSSSKPPSRGTITHEFRVRSDGSTRSFTLVDDWITDRDLSPQSDVARKVKAALESGSLLSEWDAGFTALARTTAADPKMDPICKLLLLRVILEAAAEGSQPFREALGPSLKLLAKTDEFRSVQWLDPEADVEDERTNARRLLEDLPDWSAVATSAADADARMRRAAARTPKPIGWLSRRKAVWSIRGGVPDVAMEIKNGGRLVVAVPVEDRGDWVDLGTLRGGSEDAVVLARPDLGVEGRLVFLQSRETPDLASGKRSVDR